MTNNARHRMTELINEIRDHQFKYYVLDKPVFGLATGQALDNYDGDLVFGSATICETI